MCCKFSISAGMFENSILEKDKFSLSKILLDFNMIIGFAARDKISMFTAMIAN